MIVAAPVEAPLHSTFVAKVLVVKDKAGCVMLIVLVEVQPLASVTVTVKIPAGWLVITEVVAPDDHK